MSRILNRYRIYCNTEATNVYEWAETEPIDCPNNNAHSIDSNLTTIIDSVNEGNSYGTVLDLNSTTIALGATASFIGTYENVLSYSEVTFILRSDQPGYYIVDFSTDGVNEDRSIQYDLRTDRAEYHAYAVISNYMRIRVFNFGTPQTYLRVQAIGHTAKSKALTATSNSQINKDNDVQLMRIVNDPLLDFSRLLIEDKTVIRKFGANSNISATLETIWTGSNDYTWLTSAETLDVVSNNAQDDGAGLGARKVIVDGLDANYEEVWEEVSLVGNSTVTTTQSFFRVNRAYVTECGTYHGSNYNDINIQTGTSGILLSQINGGDTFGALDTAAYGNGQSQQAIYSIPVGKTGFISRIEVIVDTSNRDASLFLYQVQDIDNISSNIRPRRLIWRLDGIQDRYQTEFKSYIRIPEKTDLWFEGTASQPLNNSTISVNFDLYLINNQPAGLS